MNTKKLYDEDAYTTAFEAVVIVSDGCDVVLDQTAFFPEEGGQTPDKGTLTLLLDSAENDVKGDLRQTSDEPHVETNAADPTRQLPDLQNTKTSPSELPRRVLDVQLQKDGSIRHTLDAPLPKGARVRGKLDWAHRFSNMQNHTGEHIFSGLVHARFGYDNVGFHLSDNIVTMDYNGTLTAENIQELEIETNQRIFENRTIR